ncbi:MAG: 1-deoxy-D-xylulose-5-phosphate synthase, partial [Zoogloeaceae bacterium]|nr:1-deoxy-D-xylulose-5-phosphate synthase [Zoogloeaceae bacterium]
RVAILAFGSMLPAALAAGEELDATVANMRFVKPLDAELIRALAAEHELLVTVEENAVIGGVGSEVSRWLANEGIATRTLQLGLPDAFIDHGDQGQLLVANGLDAAAIVTATSKALRKS